MTNRSQTSQRLTESASAVDRNQEKQSMKKEQYSSIDEIFEDCGLEPMNEAEFKESARIERLIRFRIFNPAANSIRAKGLTPAVLD